MDFKWATRKSRFIHYFDKTPTGIICPHFYVLSHANGCPYDCHYCYLQLTFRHRLGLTVFQNLNDLADEVQDWLNNTEKPALLNAGELSDGLATDHLTGLSKILVPLFSKQKRHKLLFLTKSTNIQNLLAMEPTPQVVGSFSINAPEVSRQFEPSAPNPLERLQAAGQLIKHGWTVRLRIDPIVPVEGWKEIYGRLTDAILRLERIETVTLGSLRYFQSLPGYSRRGKEIFGYASTKDGSDKRIRVEKELRLEMYKSMMQKLSGIPCKLGLCKETQELHNTLGLAGKDQSCNGTAH